MLCPENVSKACFLKSEVLKNKGIYFFILKGGLMGATAPDIIMG